MRTDQGLNRLLKAGIILFCGKSFLEHGLLPAVGISGGSAIVEFIAGAGVGLGLLGAAQMWFEQRQIEKNRS